jgi:rhomboid family GlyGly-CTERM serine protease
MTRLPVLTALLCTLAGGLALLPATVQASLYFDQAHLLAGNWAGLLSGHWMHVDTGHLIWNLGALAVLAAMIEQYSRRLLLMSILAGTLSIDLLLLSPLGDVARYCGLSGVLNTLLGVALFLLWQRTRSLMSLLVGTLCALKIAVEIRSGQSLFTNVSWPPYAAAHLAGLIATPIALLLGYRDTVITRITTRMGRKDDEHLVTSA